MSAHTEGPAPWERQDGETDKAYAAFCIYRDLPPNERSLRAAAAKFYGKDKEKLRRPPATFEKWSTRWRWVERARAWDEEQDRLAREAQLQAIKEMRERHAEQARYLQAKGIQALRDLAAGKISAGDAIRLIIEGARLERISRGEPETIQETRSSWTDAVLAAWEKRMQQQAGQGDREQDDGT